jgi:hypothetical protein
MDADRVLQMMWAYQESCGYGNPMKRRLQGIDYLMAINERKKNEVQ